MKILYLTKHSKLGGSSRMRSFQYIPFLKEEGHEIKVASFFDEAYLKAYNSGNKSYLAILKAYIKRFFVLFTVFKYDGLVIEKELFPYLPSWGELLLHLFGIKYIVDYDDAIFHNYDFRSGKITRLLLRNKIKRVMRYSRTVVVGNEYLADYAKKSKAKRIVIIPTVIDLNRYEIKKNSDETRFVIGWIGTRSTFEDYLSPCRPWLMDIQEEHEDIAIHIIGIENGPYWGKNVQYIPWSEDTEVQEIKKMDIGLMPLQDLPWERGKCAYKLIQYAACAVPSLASDVGMNKDVCVDGVTGYIIQEDEWKERVLQLKKDRMLRLQMGKAGRKVVEEKYCLGVTVPVWKRIIEESF